MIQNGSCFDNTLCWALWDLMPFSWLKTLFKLNINCTWSNWEHGLKIYLEYNWRNSRILNLPKIFLDQSKALQYYYRWFQMEKISVTFLLVSNHSSYILYYINLSFLCLESQSAIALIFMFENVNIVKLLTD